MRQAKIVIVGAGLVGGSAALFAAVTIPSAELVLIDVARVRAEGQAMDLAHAAAFWGDNRFYAGDYDNARDADVVVITAGVGVKPGQTRLDLARINADIATEIVDRIAPLAPWQSTLLPATLATYWRASFSKVFGVRGSGLSAQAPPSTPADCARFCPTG